jgi:hypothetical protein
LEDNDMKKVFALLTLLALLTVPVYATITAGAITTAKLAAGAVTADKITVTTLSAITADMGTLTAGTITGGLIDGATVRAGSGDEVVLDSSGITFTEGGAANNKVKWTDGSSIQSDDGNITVDANGGQANVNADGDVQLVSGQTVYLQGGTAVQIGNFSGGGSTSFVCHNNAGTLYSSTTTCDGSVPEVAALRAEVAELRALVNQLAQQR